jgi:hypothetical protein
MQTLISLVAAAAVGCGYVANSPSTPSELEGQDVTAVVVVKFQDRICSARPDNTVLCIDSPPSIRDQDTIYGPLGARTTTLPAPIVHLASGGWGVCALLSDTSVWCWAETDSANDPIAVASGVADLAMSAGGLLCTRSNAGAITCSGNANTPFQSDSYTGLGPDGLGPAQLDLGKHAAAAISIGESQLDVLLEDSTVAAWDLDHLASGMRPVGVADAVAISAGTGWIGGGGEHACAVIRDGSARCWGANDAGQLGRGSASDAPAAPLAVVRLADVAQVAAGSSHSCARRQDGAVLCWGASGEFAGCNDQQSEEGWYSAVPVLVPDVRDAIDVSAGTVVNCALTASSRVVCWGGDHYRGWQIGTGGGYG